MFCAYTRPRYQVRVYRTIGPLIQVPALNLCSILKKDSDEKLDRQFNYMSCQSIICPSCFQYFRKTGCPSHNFSVVKKYEKNVALQILNFSPYGVMLILSLFSLQ